MGCRVERVDEGLRVTGTGHARGHRRSTCTTSASWHPAVAALCALAASPSHLRGIAHIRGHETDRLAALATELGALGADVTEHADGLSLRPARPARRASSTPTPTTGWPTPASSSAPPSTACWSRTSRPPARRSPTSPASGPGSCAARAQARLRVGGHQPMSGRYTEHDHEHYERPRRRTRPRTKERPTYDDAVDGVVVTVDRGRLTLLVDGTTVMAMKARPLGRKGVVVGDRVRVVGDISGADGLAWPGSSRSPSGSPRCAVPPTTTTRSSG